MVKRAADGKKQQHRIKMLLNGIQRMRQRRSSPTEEGVVIQSVVGRVHLPSS